MTPLILITDDVASVLEFHRILLNRYGYDNILATTDARDALRLAQVYHPVLVISDISKPDMSGFELLQRLREDPETSNIRFLFVTARASARERAIMAGADGFILKPMRPSDFISVVQALLST